MEDTLRHTANAAPVTPDITAQPQPEPYDTTPAETSEPSSDVPPAEKGNGHNEDEASPESDGHDDKNATGAELNRVPSQAQKLGKKKVAIVMIALCVCVP